MVGEFKISVTGIDGCETVLSHWPEGYALERHGEIVWRERISKIGCQVDLEMTEFSGAVKKAALELANIILDKGTSLSDYDAAANRLAELVSRIATYDVATAKTSMKWLPIETAPRDGTKVFIREKSGRAQVAAWRASWGAEPDWYVQLTGGYSDDYPTTDVRYWMPIPDVEDEAAK